MSLLGQLSVPRPKVTPAHTRASLTRSRGTIKAWSQDCLATGPQPVWPTTRLSTFSTASTSPAGTEMELRAGKEERAGALPQLSAAPYSLARSPPRGCLALPRSQPCEGLPASAAIGERPGTAVSSCSQPRRRTSSVPAGSMGETLSNLCYIQVPWGPRKATFS